MTYANSTTATTTAPHSNSAALPSQSPYQQRTTQRENPTQQLIKQAVDYLLQQLEAGKSETLTAYLAAMARFHSYIRYVPLLEELQLPSVLPARWSPTSEPGCSASHRTGSYSRS